MLWKGRDINHDKIIQRTLENTHLGSIGPLETRQIDRHVAQGTFGTVFCDLGAGAGLVPKSKTFQIDAAGKSEGDEVGEVQCK